jgi:hypothetical protein
MSGISGYEPAFLCTMRRLLHVGTLQVNNIQASFLQLIYVCWPVTSWRSNSGRSSRCTLSFEVQKDNIFIEEAS